MGTDSKKEESQNVLDINRPSHGRTYVSSEASIHAKARR